MDIQVFADTPKHIIVDGFASAGEVEQLLDEFETLRGALGAGQVLRGDQATQSVLKKNHNVWLDDVYRGRRDDSLALRLFKERLGSEAVRWALGETRDLLFAYSTLANADATQLSVYGPGDYYGEHCDEYPSITANLMVCSTPRRFTGGDFHLGDDDVLHPRRPRRHTRIDFRPGRLLMFPARAHHHVDTVQGQDLAFRDGRFTVQMWSQFVTRNV